MAIRKISELPYVDCSNRQASQVNRFRQSRFEVSYSRGEDEATAFGFDSKQIKAGELANAIKYEITGSPDQTEAISTDFYVPVTFHNEVNVLAQTTISGNVSMEGGNLNLNFGDGTIAADSLNINGNNVSLNDGLVAINPDGVAIGGDLVIENVGTHVLSGNLSVDSDVQVSGTWTQYGNLTCYGEATFTKDIRGCALSAKWADLAEMYKSDAPYPPGTLVKFGGEQEITIADDEVNAVITTKPGLVLGDNGFADGFQGIALVGRVPVRVCGKVVKFDRLVLSNIPGIARKRTEFDEGAIIGIALQDSGELDEHGVALVEAVVKLVFV